MSFFFFDWLPSIRLGTWRPDVISGSNRADIIISFGSADVIDAKGGNDIILSGGGNDEIDAGAGNDLVEAGSGNDTIRGGRGDDTIHGGSGFDTAVYAGSFDDYALTLPRFSWQQVKVRDLGNGDVDRLTSVEALYFEADDLTVFIDGRNNAVLAGDDAAITDEDTSLSIAAASLLANDRDFDGDAITVTGVSATSALGATVSLSTGVVTYDQGALFQSLGVGETVEDSFTYTVDDGRGGADTATVTVTVTGINDAPEISSADAASVEENSDAVVLTVAATDVDGDAAGYAISGGDDASAFEIDAVTGELRFLAAPDFEAPSDLDGDNVYEVTVEGSDGLGGVASQDVLVTVTDVVEAPVVTPRINEFHYDDASTDSGEFVEIRVGKDADVSSLRIDLYNGSASQRSTYANVMVSTLAKTSDADYDYYVWNRPVDGIQNGSPDGIALSDADGVIEFLSYEGVFEAANGPAAGLASTDILVSEGGSDPEGLSLQRTGDGPTDWTGPEAETPGAANEPIVVEVTPRINEVHYDDASTDSGEFVEIRVGKDADVSSLRIDLYNGSASQRSTYADVMVSTLTKTSDADYDYYVWNRPVDGIQNGSPDGIALSDADGVIEFLSYEGVFEAANGPAAGVTSSDILVSENGSDPEGLSLQRTGDGPTDWTGPAAQTPGAANDGGPVVVPLTAARINEIHYDNDGTDTGEFVEIRVNKNADVSGVQIELYNLTGGATYGSTALAGLTKTSDADYDYYVWDIAGIQNGPQDGVALSNNGAVLEFVSYEGTLTATNGTAAGLTSTDIGVEETASTPAGQSLQRTGDGLTDWIGPIAETKGAANGGGVVDPGDPTPYFISQIQGTGAASLLVGEYVLVSAVVTYTVGNGFFLQEEAADSDGSDLTSEGIFVFTGGAPTVAVGDLVALEGTVTEFGSGSTVTELTGVTINSVASGALLPDYASITIPNASADALEQFEGMRVSLTSGTSDPITVTENFDFARFGEIAVSAGNKYQPTQLLDPDTEAALIADLIAQNALNRLVIDDANNGQNPTEFRHVAVSVAEGDNGNGYLDSGDTFSADGPTLRLGAEMDGPINGVLHYDFGDYRMYVDGTLPIDEATNSGARPDAPADVGGTLKVASFNVLNYFTTLDDGMSGGAGPNNLEPRGATTAFDLARQTEKTVTAMLTLGADVYGLQEIENGGFGDGSAIDTLVDALNAAVGSNIYAFVDPTDDAGFIGTDAITTGFIYDQTKVSVVASDFLVFDDGGQQQNRPAVAATFEEIASGETFTVAVNHFKSKGGTGTGDDADIGDGQGAFNGTRTRAAEQLVDWLDSDPTGSGDGDYLIIGDLNSYAQEDPVDVIRDAGYIDLIDQFIGQENAYSYVFDGQRGTLDQGLASASMADQVTGATEWHINADEPGLLSYSSEFNDPGFFNGDDPFAASDHDPLVIGLDLGVSDTAFA